jgi:hypothetical protein
MSTIFSKTSIHATLRASVNMLFTRDDSVSRGQIGVLPIDPLRTFPEHTTVFNVLYVGSSAGLNLAQQIQLVRCIPCWVRLG